MQYQQSEARRPLGEASHADPTNRSSVCMLGEPSSVTGRRPGCQPSWLDRQVKNSSNVGQELRAN